MEQEQEGIRTRSKTEATGAAPWRKDDTVLEDEGFKAPIFYFNPEGRKNVNTNEFKHDLLPALRGSYYLRLNTDPHQFGLLENRDSRPVYVSVAFLKALATNKVNWATLDFFKIEKAKKARQRAERKAQNAAKKNGEAIDEEEAGVVTEKKQPKLVVETSHQESHVALDTQTVLNEMHFIQHWKDYWYALNLWNDLSRQQPVVPYHGICCIPVRSQDGEPKLLRSKNGMSWFDQTAARRLKNNWYTQLDQMWDKDSGQPWFRSRYSSVKLDRPMIVHRKEEGKRIPDDDWEAICDQVNQLTDSNQDSFGSVVVHLDDKKLPTGYIATSTCPFGFYATYIHQSDYNKYMENLRRGNDPPCRNPFNYDKMKHAEWLKVVNKYKSHEVAIKNPNSDVAKFRGSHNFKNNGGLYGHGCSFSGIITPEKIRGVRGTRKGKTQQSVVMDGKAPVMASALGWEHIDEKSHLYAAELTLKHRYEKAWQNLFIFEDILKKEFTTQHDIQGSLSIVTNDEDDMNDLELDFEEPTKDFKWKTLDETSIKPVNIETITKDYKFLAYTISYRVNMSSPSYFMDRKTTELKIKFYPFQRPFFHRFESAFDSRLFTKMRAIVTNTFKEAVKNNNLPDVPCRISDLSLPLTPRYPKAVEQLMAIEYPQFSQQASPSHANNSRIEIEDEDEDERENFKDTTIGSMAHKDPVKTLPTISGSYHDLLSTIGRTNSGQTSTITEINSLLKLSISQGHSLMNHYTENLNQGSVSSMEEILKYSMGALDMRLASNNPTVYDVPQDGRKITGRPKNQNVGAEQTREDGTAKYDVRKGKMLKK
ncbi:hypothetical protein FLONG3_6757 [Fusarium longipes]|uniref:Uncharacterized protein n=1 Tax=Fusarium longipes TaxID=694270 RepID=A0A395SIZ6_9HYPO|nr:hypothetical protein FLONG3_6757 [Fusarium longipes]